MSFSSKNMDKLIGRKFNGDGSLSEVRLLVVNSSKDDTSSHTKATRQTADDCSDEGPSLDVGDDYRRPDDWEDPLLDTDSTEKGTSCSAYDNGYTAIDEIKKDGCLLPCSSTSWFFCSLNRQEKLVILSLAVVCMTSLMCLSVMAPFIPIEARRKGLSITVSGWIFSILPLVQFAVSPFIGKLLPVVGSRNMIIFGQLSTGTGVVGFGFIDKVDNYSAFLASCLLLRVLMAVGCAAIDTSAFAIVGNLFPAKASTVLGLLETTIGLGLMIGPAVGGVLYELGGFQLPFILLGSTMLISSIPMYFFLPAKDGSVHSRKGSMSMSQLLRIPAVIVVCLSIFVATLVWSLFSPILEPHLENFNVSPSVIGLLFLLVAACYAITSLISGTLADRMSDCSPILIVGFFSMSVTLLLLGPSPWLGFGDSENYMSLTIVSLIALGICESLTIVPTYNKILDAVKKTGIEYDFKLYGMVSGIWNSCFSLGELVGPALGGWLTDRDGFPRCLSYISVVCSAMGTIVLALWIWEKWKAQQSVTIRTIGDNSLETPKDIAEYGSDVTDTETGELLTP